MKGNLPFPRRGIPLGDARDRSLGVTHTQQIAHPGVFSHSTNHIHGGFTNPQQITYVARPWFHVAHQGRASFDTRGSMEAVRGFFERRTNILSRRSSLDSRRSLADSHRYTGPGSLTLVYGHMVISITCMAAGIDRHVVTGTKAYRAIHEPRLWGFSQLGVSASS